MGSGSPEFFLQLEGPRMTGDFKCNRFVSEQAYPLLAALSRTPTEVLNNLDSADYSSGSAAVGLNYLEMTWHDHSALCV
jgi:hypothetical protein